MFAKSLLTGAMLLLSVTSVQAAQASLSIFTDDECQNVISARVDTVVPGSGCTQPTTVQPFKSVRLDWSWGLSAVAVCSQGYSCGDKSHNLIPDTGSCVRSINKGSYDKIQYCL